MVWQQSCWAVTPSLLVPLGQCWELQVSCQGQWGRGEALG